MDFEKVVSTAAAKGDEAASRIEVVAVDEAAGWEHCTGECVEVVDYGFR